MKRFRFDKEIGFAINQYESDGAHFIKLLRTNQKTNIGFIQVEADGIVGYHQATVQQLFIAVEGEGWVTGEDRKRISIKSGEGVIWDKGEWHESGSRTAMTSLVIEEYKNR
jgi:quercetin dioxygenase-like cupin family protein